MLPFIARENRARPLHIHGDLAVWRGWESIDGVPRGVLAVAPAFDQPSPGCLKRLRQEYELRDTLELGWAARPLQLVWEEGPTLLLEDPGGKFLDGLLGNPMRVGVFLRFALGLARAAGKMHQHGLIHKDLKPVHILVDETSGAAWLTGFGHASRLLRERQSPDPPETIAGTLAYMAPEQTGRMNRSIDSRSDLYSLGVVFYQMLTGSLPFNAADPLDWVHCHIAHRPLPPAELAPAIPAALSAIVMKLLAKTAEERYQTAAGLECDLKRCLSEWEAQGCIGDFPLGQRDIPDRLLIPEKLYGREREVETLLAAFDRVAGRGAPELVLVSGYSGIGKSSVVNELHKALVPPRGLFASGKFDQYKRDIPYATLAQAFVMLIQPLLSKSDAELESWRRALKEALGPNGRLIADLVPELKLIIGEQPPVPELEPSQAKARFQLVFRRFLGVFARPEHPLALFVDDLQWLDAATLDVIEDLLTQEHLRHLLLIGAYRDNELSPTHPLMRKLEAIRKTGAKVQEITLSPLSLEDVTQLVADSLHCEPARAALLAQLVHAKTAGNPFFSIQFLSALAEEGLVAFNHGEGCWSWELSHIQAKGDSDNVADFMARKLARLSGSTRNALQQLACLGNIAQASTLSLVLETSEEKVHAALQEALSQGLVQGLDGSYKFVHDRVHEAAYALIPKSSRAEAHLKTGRALLAQTPREKLEEAAFEIVSQLNRGAALITSPDEREELARLNLIAGKRAKASTAYAAALTYFAAGAALLAEDCWERQHGLAFALEINWAECEYLTGELAVADKHLATLAVCATDTVERASVACLRVDLYMTLDQTGRAVEVGLDYLRHLGVDWRPHPAKEEARQEYQRIWSRLGKRRIEDLVDLPLARDVASLATLEVLIKLRPAALFTDESLASLVICRAVNLSLDHGNSDVSCVAYVSLGTIAGSHFGDYEAGFRFGQLGYELVEQRGFKRFQARAYMIFGIYVMPWARHFKAGRNLLRRAFEAANKSGDLTYAGYSCHVMVTNLLMAGDPLNNVQSEAGNGLGFVQKTQFGFVVDVITSQLGLIRMLRGLTRKFGSFDDEQFDELQFERHLSSKPELAVAQCWHWIRKLQALFIAGDYPAAIKSLERAQRLLWASTSFIEMADYYFYGALAHAAYCDSISGTERQQHAGAIAACHKQLEIWAKHCPENFENRAALAGAEIARIEGRERDAMDLYERAIRSARENGFIHNEALANELAARFYASLGFETISDAYLRNARRCYLRWGADGKVSQLDQLYPQLRDEPPIAGATGTIGAPVEQLDLATVIKVSQAVSGEIVPEKLIETIMRTAMAQAGAVRGLLILVRGDEPRIAAEASASGDAVTVCQRDEAVAGAALPEAALRYVMRTRESLILDDASTDQSSFAADPYVRRRQARSILCLPLINQAKLIGVLYLENNLAPCVFAPARIAVLKLLASQAAITLENAHLYRDLSEREAKIRHLVDANIIGIFTFQVPSNGPDAGDPAFGEVNDAFLRMLGYDREEFTSRCRRRSELTPPEWQDRDKKTISTLREFGVVQPFEKEYFRKDGSRVPVLAGFASFDEPGTHGVAFVLDLTERKRAEKELRILAEQRAVLETALNRSHEGAYINDSAGRFLYVNDEACRALGYSREELLALCVPDIDPNYSAEHVALILRETREKGPFTIETSHRRKDGRIFPVELTLSAFDYGGKNYYIALARDITERKRAEEELRTLAEERAILENALNQSHEGVYLLDGARFLYVNDEACRALGYSREELLTMAVPDIDPDYPEERVALSQKRTREDGPRTFETNHRRKDGRTFPVEITSSAFSYAGKDYHIALARDITERKRAEEALKRSEAYLAEAQKLTRTGSWAWDLIRDRMLHCSEEIFGIYGLDAGVGIPAFKTLMQRVHPEDRDRVMESTLEGARKKEERLIEYRIVRPDGTLKYIESVRRPVLDEAGNAVEIVGTSIDVTERKRDEVERERLRKLEADLAHVDRISMLGELAASLAHEIKQPITGAVTSANACLRWLARDPPDLEKARAAALRIERDGTRAAEVINRLRAFYKKDTPAQRDLIDVNAVIREMIALLHSEAIQHSISVRHELADGIPRIIADRVQLQQVLINLMLNAIEAMNGGTDRELTIRSELHADGQLLISVSDTGLGFPAEDAEYIFDPFVTTKPQGTGMGLAITRSLVESHGGRVWAAPNSGPGATFYFTLPIQNTANE